MLLMRHRVPVPLAFLRRGQILAFVTAIDFATTKTTFAAFFALVHGLFVLRIGRIDVVVFIVAVLAVLGDRSGLGEFEDALASAELQWVVDVESAGRERNRSGEPLRMNVERVVSTILV